MPLSPVVSGVHTDGCPVLAPRQRGQDVPAPPPLLPRPGRPVGVGEGGEPVSQPGPALLTVITLTSSSRLVVVAVQHLPAKCNCDAETKLPITSKCQVIDDR